MRRPLRQIRNRKVSSRAFERLESRWLLATTRLEINPDGPSDPTWPTDVAGQMYFVANDGVHGNELWTSDGTPSGTRLVKDIFPGPTAAQISNLVDVGDKLYFVAHDGVHGAELWKSDGTADGTILVKDILLGQGGSNPALLKNAAGELYFTADDGERGRELWRSDGTADGTQLVADIHAGEPGSNIGAILGMEDVVYFSADNGISGTELWKTDGTEAGTRQVVDLISGDGASTPRELTNLHGLLMFVADDDAGQSALWSSDGTQVGTAVLPSTLPDQPMSDVHSLTVVGDYVFFSAHTPVRGTELWKSSGTAETTDTFLPWPSLDFGTSVNPSDIIDANGAVAFRVGDSEVFYAYDPATTEFVFNARGSRLIADGGRVYYLYDGKLYQSDSVVSHQMARTRRDVTWFDVSGDHLFIASADRLWAAPIPPMQTVEFSQTTLDVTSTAQSLTLRRSSPLGPTRVRIVPHHDSARQGLDFEPIIVDFLDGDLEKEFDLALGVESQVLKTVRLRVEKVSPHVVVTRDVAKINFVDTPTRLLANETLGVTRLHEGGSHDIELTLNFEPRSDVVVNVDSSDHSAIRVEPATIRFNAGNWSRPQSVTLNGLRDGTTSTISFAIDIAASDPAAHAIEGHTIEVRVEQLGMIANLDQRSIGLDPRNPIAVGDRVFFTADDGIHGRELWVTDGTTAGTRLVRDIRQGKLGADITAWRDSHTFAAVGGTVFFFADDGVSGRELWKSDGTSAGTVMVADISPGPTSGVSTVRHHLVANDTHVFFHTSTPEALYAIFQSDGTPEGTGVIHSAQDIDDMTVVGDRVFYVQYDDQVRVATAGERDNLLIGEFDTGNDSSFPFVPRIDGLTGVGDKLFFRRQYYDSRRRHFNELWVSDGTPEGTRRLSTGHEPLNLTDVDGTLYFQTGKYDSSINFGFWKTDGVERPTPVDAPPTRLRKESDPFSFPVIFKDVELFPQEDKNTGTELWKRDLSTGATSPVFDGGKEEGSNPVSLTNVHGTVMFGTDGKLWMASSTGAELIQDLPVHNVPQYPLPTHILGDGGRLHLFTEAKNRFYFARDNRSSHDGALWTELWVSDGTPAGTTLVSCCFDYVNYYSSGSEIPTPHLATLGDKLVYDGYGYGGFGAGLSTHDGHESSVLRERIKAGKMVAAGDWVFFGGVDGEDGRQLWRTDGTTEGTSPVKTIRVQQDALYDPTPACSDTACDADYQIAAFGDRVVFSADDGLTGIEPWISDGTADGTFRLRDINPGKDTSDPEDFTVAGELLFFTAVDEAGRGLWKTDGTPEGTVLVKDGFDSFSPPKESGHFLAVDDLLYFAATNDAGSELWRSDGTEAGTYAVKDILPGPASSNPSWFASYRGDVYFVADDGVHGPEVWKTDGTEDGTRLVQDVWAGEFGSDPSFLAADDAALYFVADDGVHGREIWSYVPLEQSLIGDIDQDGEVDFADFTVLAANYGKEPTNGLADGDLNDDASIDFTDFLLLAESFRASRSDAARMQFTASVDHALSRWNDYLGE